MLRSGDFSLLLQGFRSRLNFYLFAKNLNGYEFISFASPVDPNQRKGDPATRFLLRFTSKNGQGKNSLRSNSLPY
ncbi:MAG: hypothetical protein DSZ29_08135 [Aquificaceae bacterium]|nr:MAG: hypothetical protein DSZ29_08135 [Aquificaceae bacterium]